MTPASRLRVLHLRNSDRFGGPERLILDQVRLAGPCVEPILVSFGSSGAVHPFLDRAREEGATTYTVPEGGAYDPRTPAVVRSLIHRIAPDVVVGHDYKADMVLALAARGRPRVALVHGYTAEDPKIRFFEAVDRRLLRSVDAVVAVSDALGARLEEAGVPARKIHVVPNGVDADRVAFAAVEGRAAVRTEWGFPDDVVVVLVLGRLSPEKGPDVALEAFAGLPQEHTHLVLVGDGALRSALETRAQADDLRGRVRFAGWRDDPWACLGAADVFLLPSRREGLPLALLEAMAARTPIVATDVGAVRDVLGEDGTCGRLVPPDDPVALGRALAELLDDECDLRNLVAAAHERVVTAYGAERQVRALEAIYASVSR